jgi:hypothetical protein
MTPKPFAALVAALLALSACQKSAENPPVPAEPAAAPAVTEAARPAATPVATSEATPAPASSTAVSVLPSPTPCGSEKLQNYLNLLPTATAKDEIAKTVGHNRIRYVGPNDVVTQEFREDRLTAELGVDGRIKAFRCG